MLAEAGDSVKRFGDSVCWNWATGSDRCCGSLRRPRLLRRVRFRQVSRSLAEEAGRSCATACGRSSPRQLLHTSLYFAPSAVPSAGRIRRSAYPAIADAVADFVYARLQRAATRSRLAILRSSSMPGRSAFNAGPQGANPKICRAWARPSRRKWARRVCLRDPRRKVRAPAGAMGDCTGDLTGYGWLKDLEGVSILFPTRLRARPLSVVVRMGVWGLWGLGYVGERARIWHGRLIGLGGRWSVNGPACVTPPLTDNLSGDSRPNDSCFQRH